MKLKKDSKSIRQRQFTEKYLKNSFTNETTKINVNALNVNDQDSVLYSQFIKFSTNELEYKLTHEKLSNTHKKVIKKILDERKR